MKYILIFILATSCKAVDISGPQKVQYVKKYQRNQVVKFYGLRKEFVSKTDTIKKNDYIILKPKQ